MAVPVTGASLPRLLGLGENSEITAWRKISDIARATQALNTLLPAEHTADADFLVL